MYIVEHLNGNKTVQFLTANEYWLKSCRRLSKSLHYRTLWGVERKAPMGLLRTFRKTLFYQWSINYKKSDLPHKNPDTNIY